MIIDVHAHLIPKETPSDVDDPAWPAIKVNAQGKRQLMFLGKKPIQVEEAAYDLSARLAFMDRYNIGVQLVSPPPFFFAYDLPPKTGNEVCQWMNNEFARYARESGGRIQAIGTVPLQDVGLAVQEVERVHRELDLRGIAVGSSVNGKNLDDEEFDSFWQKINDLGVPVLLGPYGGMDTHRLKKHNFGNLIGNGAEMATAAGSLIFGRVLDKYPRLKICLSMGGGSLLPQIYRMNHGYNAAEVRSLEREPVEYLRQFYYDTIVYSPDFMTYLANEAGVDKLLFGSDFPFDMGDLELPKKLRQAFGETDSERIYSDNARQLFKI